MKSIEGKYNFPCRIVIIFCLSLPTNCSLVFHFFLSPANQSDPKEENHEDIKEGNNESQKPFLPKSFHFRM